MAADHVGVVMKHTWPAMLLSLIMPFPGLLVYMGGLDRLLCEWRQEGYVPAHKPLNGLRQDVWRMTRVLARMTFISLIVIVEAAQVMASTTLGGQDFDFDALISIHAPVKGATYLIFLLIFVSLYFNPRTREGCDLLAVR